MKRAAETETASGLSLKKPGRLSPSAGPVRPGIPALFILVIFGLILAVLVIGWKSLRLYAEKFEQEINAHLTAIAELKAAEITQWRRERLLDAAYLERNTLLADLVRQVLQNPPPSEAVRRLETWLAKYLAGGQYVHIQLLNPGGKSVLDIPRDNPRQYPEVLRRLPVVIGSGQAEILDFHRSEGEQHAFLSLLVPVADDLEPESVLAVLVLHIDPTAYLYPFITRWPVPSETAETLIIRRDGDTILYLNELRFQKDAALNLRIPISIPTIAGLAAQGQKGIIKGTDYRGERVIGYAREIPDSPWFLIARIDEKEAFAPVRKRFWTVIVLVVSVLFGLLAAAYALLLRKTSRFLRERTEAARNFHMLSSRQEALLAALPEIIMEVDRNKVYIWANQRGMDFFGDDVIGKEAAEYFVGEQNTYQAVESVFEGSDDLVYVESWQRRKDGEARLLAWWCLTLKDPDGHLTGALSSARDITEQRKSEQSRRESEARYQNLVDNAPLAILVNQENRIVLANAACLRLFGATSPDQILGKSPYDLFHPDFHEAMRGRIATLRAGQVVPTLEEKIVRLDGAVIDVEVTAAPFRDGGVNAIHVVVNDITGRKEAENRMKSALEALRSSEEKFRNAFTTSPDSININRMSDGMYVQINRGFIQAMGYAEEEIIGHTSLEFNVWADPEDRRRLVEGLRKDGVVENLEARFRRKNGETVVGLMSASVIIIEGVPHILSITRDISDRKRAETALKESEAKFRNIFENIQDVYYETALDGTILEISPSIGLLGGGQYAREDLLGKSILDFYAHPEERAAFLAKLQKEGRLADHEVTLRNRDETLIHCSLTSRIFFDAAGRPVKVVGSMRDIGERKKAEARTEAALAALRENEAIFDQFMKNSPVFMFFKDEDIRAIRLSANYEKMLGMPVENALGKTMDDLFPSALSKSMIADDKRILEEGRQVTVDEELNGRYYTTIKFPIHVEGKPRHLAGFTIDITERKLAELGIKEALEALRVSLREKELLLQEVHHRVKNNLQIISSLFSLEAEHTGEETRRILKRGQTRIRSLSLVHEKLYRAADLSRIDLPGYIKSLATHLFHVYLVDAGKVRLETDFEEVSLDINSAIPCGLILNELISNALKHAFPEDRTGIIRIRLARVAGGSVELEVSDDGIGIPESLDMQNPEGFGFQIINLLVGQLEAHLSLDRKDGTTFTLRFKELKYKPRM